MSVTRRIFLKTVAVAGAAVAAGVDGGCGNPVDAAPAVDATLSPTGELVVALAQHPSLQPIGGALTLALGAGGDILVVHRGAPGDDPEWIAVDALCTHLRCPLGYSVMDRAIECPCHASRFLAQPEGQLAIGTPTHPPATIALRNYPVAFDATANALTISVAGACAPPLDPARPPVMVAAATGNMLKLSLAQPALAPLATVGGFVTAVAPAGACDRLILVRDSATTIKALSSVCTHAGCDVDYAAGRRQLACHCHGSTFDLAGKNLTGPAPSPLTVYAVLLDGDELTITIPSR